LKLADLVDAVMLQSMMDDFSELTRIPMALIDLDGAVVVGSGWQDVCTQFHRVNPQTCAHCIESDTVLTADIPVSEVRLYQCKNGMWDAATPIFVGGEHLGNLFTGQFFFDDEPVDLEFFRSQARRYGFDEVAYLAAVDAVPRLSREVVDTGLSFLTKLSSMISQLSYSNTQRTRAEERLTAALASQTSLTEELAAERSVLHAIMENTETHLAYLDPDFNFVVVNSTYARGSGHTEAELIGRNHFDLFPDAENQAVFERARATGEPLEYRAKPFEFADQPWRGVTYWDWRLASVKDADDELVGFAFSLQDVTRIVRERGFSDAINRLNKVIHSNLDFDALLAQFVPELAAATGCEVVTVSLRAEDGTWYFPEVLGLPAELKERSLTDDDMVGAMEALATGAPVVIMCADASQPAPGLPGEYGLRSLLVAPLSLAGRRLGAVSYGYVSGPGEFDDGDIDFASKIAASLSLALNNSRLYRDERYSARLSKTLATVNEILLSTLMLEDVLARLVGEVSEVAGADKSLVVAVDDGAYTVTHVRNVSGELVGVAGDASVYPAFASAAEQGEPLLIEDNFADRRTNKDFVVPHGLRAFQLLPLMTRGAVTHVLALAYDEPQSFHEEDQRSAERMAAAMSVALNNARLFENEHRIADRLQEALLTLPEQIEGLEFAQAYHSATEAARVGGDFYDIFELDQDRVGITIGDIAGKGIDAAMLTSLVKNTIRAHASERGKTPAQVLALTNDVVHRSTPTEAFATVFFAVLDRADGRLVYVNAGHTTAVLRGGHGVVSNLLVTSPLIGAFAACVFEQAEAQFGVGDLLFLYTDGLTESRCDGEQYGEERVFSVVSAVKEPSARHVVDEVIADVMAFTGNRLRDDLAILAVKRLEGGGER